MHKITCDIQDNNHHTKKLIVEINKVTQIYDICPAHIALYMYK